LIATIHQFRPDLLQQETTTATPIPTDPPLEFRERQKGIANIEDIGQPPLASLFTMENVDPTNWYNTLTLLATQHNTHVNIIKVDVREI